MRIHLVLVSLLVLPLLCLAQAANTPAAQPPPADNSDQDRAARIQAANDQERANSEQYIQSIAEKVEISGGQRRAMREKLDQHLKATEDWNRQHRLEFDAAFKALIKADESGDAEAMKRARETYQKVGEPLAKLRRAAFEDALSVLADDQRIALLAGQVEGFVGSQTFVAKYKLTKDQQAQISAICLQAARDVQGKPDSDSELKALEQAWDAFLAQVPATEEQKQLAAAQPDPFNRKHAGH